VASRSRSTRLAAVAAGALLSAALGTATAVAAVQDPIAIGPNQVFAGQVNGDEGSAVIQTSCFGPIILGETGHPTAGQYVEAVLAPTSATSTGFTGSAADSLLVALDAATPATTGLIGTLNGYYIQLPIPTTLTVPCSGTGVVAFVPAPTSPTAKTATVSVTFLSGPAL
jgi:hypothetical protein